MGRKSPRRVVAVAGLALALPVLVGAPAGAQQQPVATPRSLDNACPAEIPLTFVDVAAADTHAEAIACAAFHGIAKGGVGTRSADQYAPDVTLTRAQAATFLARLVDDVDPELLPAWDGTDRFTDITAGDVHQPAINRLAAAGLLLGGVDGRPADQFGPGWFLKRDQMATLLNRLHAFLTGEPLSTDVSYFDDLDGVLPEHVANINGLASEGIVAGYTGDQRSYRAKLTVDRDQMASFLMRELDLRMATS